MKSYLKFITEQEETQDQVSQEVDRQTQTTQDANSDENQEEVQIATQQKPKEETSKEDPEMDAQVQEVQDEVDSEVDDIIGNLKGKIQEHAHYYLDDDDELNEAAGILSFSVISALILSLPKIMEFIGMASKKIQNLLTKDKQWDKTKMEEWGEKLHKAYILGIAKILKVMSGQFGKNEEKDELYKKLATYLYWVLLIGFGISGVASLATNAGAYSIGAGIIKTMTTLTKVYEIGMIIIAIYLVMKGVTKELDDAVHKLEYCVEHPPKKTPNGLEALVKKGGKKPSRKTYRKLVKCVMDRHAQGH